MIVGIKRLNFIIFYNLRLATTDYIEKYFSRVQIFLIINTITWHYSVKSLVLILKKYSYIKTRGGNSNTSLYH